jgi:hypothetical protein
MGGFLMGGAQALNIGIPHLADYACLGVFSSGMIELRGMGNRGGAAQGPSWEEKNAMAFVAVVLQSRPTTMPSFPLLGFMVADRA